MDWGGAAFNVGEDTKELGLAKPRVKRRWWNGVV